MSQLRRGGCVSPHLTPCCELSKLCGDSFWHSEAGKSSLLQWAVSQQEGLFWGTRDKACLDLWDLCLLPTRQQELGTLYMLIWALLCDTQVTPSMTLNSKSSLLRSSPSGSQESHLVELYPMVL